MTVKDTTGATIGTVTKVNRSRDGRVRNVLVSMAGARRHVVPLAPSTFSVSGGVATTTVLKSSIKGH
jgi:hypothetical protein